MGEKHKHMTEDDRYAIRNGLDKGHSFKGIALCIGKDCTTVSKEVRSKRTFKKTGCVGQRFNDCDNRFGCLENGLCAGRACKHRLCRNCRDVICLGVCPRYERVFCQKRNSAPYVCNNCGDRNRCTLEKAYYEPRAAQNEHDALLHDARAGFNLDDREIERLDGIISPLLMQGQSPYHICVANADKIMLSQRSVYNYVDAGLFSARNIDMPRKVRYKKRKSGRKAKVDTGCHVGRSYVDFLAFMKSNPRVGVVEMDTVHGSNERGKALLTLHFVQCSFMLALLLDGLTAHDVSLAFAGLRRTLGCELFAELFPVILTDRGSEFTDPKNIEFDMDGEDGEGLSRVFYCDPNQSQQKGAAENNHEFIRRVVPKGEPFDPYCQDDINLMMNHINSYVCKALHGHSPMSLFALIYGNDVLEKLGAELVPPDKIVLRPSLLKH